MSEETHNGAVERVVLETKHFAEANEAVRAAYSQKQENLEKARKY